MDVLNYESQFLDERVRESLRCIYNTNGHNCSPWVRPQHIYGRRAVLDAGDGWKPVCSVDDDPAYPETNSIDVITSDGEGNDQTIEIRGMTIDEDGFTPVTQTAVLNGVEDVTLATPLARVLALRCISDSTPGGTVVVKDSAAGVEHLSIVGNINQSQKCAWTTAKNEYLLIKQMGCTATNSGGAAHYTKFSLQWQNMPEGLVIVRHSPYVVLTQQLPYINMDIDPILIIPPNNDVRVLTKTTADGCEIGAWLNGVLATIESSGE